MTQLEIKEALRICGHTGLCAVCPLGKLSSAENCMRLLMLNALDLIHTGDILLADKTEEARLLRKRVNELTAKNVQSGADLIAAEKKGVKDFVSKLMRARRVDQDGYGMIYVHDIDEITRRALRDLD